MPWDGDVNPYENQIRATAKIYYPDGTATATLLNTTCNDGSGGGYVLTAAHTLSEGFDPEDIRIVFNWENTLTDLNCGSYGPAEVANSVEVIGAVEIARGAETDMLLLRFDDLTLDFAKENNLYYAGWDVTDDVSTVGNVAIIHHAEGRIKQIAYDDDPVLQVFDYCGGNKFAKGTGRAMWLLPFYGDDQPWDYGCTTKGASGCGLLNESGNVIGINYGACLGGNGSGKFFGRLGISWELNEDLRNGLIPI
ncbi:MAG: hypothetical protein HRT71_14845 [Flavobacteriales bacterium]|nr:hypothetical protein [Flavobacteriales bacterium]